MWNLMRADLFRVVRGKCLYVTLAIFLILVSMPPLFGSGASVEIGFDDETSQVLSNDKMTGAQAPWAFFGDAPNLIFYLLSIIFTVVAVDFTSGAVKNSLAGGISRTKIYFSKLFVLLGLAFGFFVVGLLLTVLLASVFNGFGGSLTRGFLLSVLRPAGAQILLLSSAMCIGLCLAFITQKGSSFIGCYLGFFMGESLLLTLLHTYFERFDGIIKYDFILNIRALADVDSLAKSDVLRALSMGLSYIVLSTGLGLRSFVKSEIK